MTQCVPDVAKKMSCFRSIEVLSKRQTEAWRYGSNNNENNNYQ